MDYLVFTRCGDVVFYDRLKALCEEQGTTISHVSINCLGASSATATGWKNGSLPSAKILIAAAKYFGVSTDYLLGLTDIRESNQAETTDLNLSADEAFVIQKLRECEDIDMRQKIMTSVLVLLGGNPDQDRLPSLRNGEKKGGYQKTSENSESAG